MKIYHGSYVEIRIPDVYHSRKNVDFGQGFYVTLFKEQAVQWSMRFRRNEQDEAIKRLRYEKPNLQICIRNQKVIEQYLCFVESEEI